MQVTIEVPERLAGRIAAERDRLATIFEHALLDPARFGLAQEMIHFLAGDRELLEKNRGGTLTPDEKAEMDQIEALDNFFAVLRARAHRSLETAA